MRFGMSPCTSCTDSSHGRVLLTGGNSAVQRKRRFRMGWSVSALLSLLSTCSIGGLPGAAHHKALASGGEQAVVVKGVLGIYPRLLLGVSLEMHCHPVRLAQ